MLIHECQRPLIVQFLITCSSSNMAGPEYPPVLSLGVSITCSGVV